MFSGNLAMFWKNIVMFFTGRKGEGLTGREGEGLTGREGVSFNREEEAN